MPEILQPSHPKSKSIYGCAKHNNEELGLANAVLRSSDVQWDVNDYPTGFVRVKCIRHKQIKHPNEHNYFSI